MSLSVKPYIFDVDLIVIETVALFVQVLTMIETFRSDGLGPRSLRDSLQPTELRVPTPVRTIPLAQSWKSYAPVVELKRKINLPPFLVSFCKQTSNDDGGGGGGIGSFRLVVGLGFVLGGILQSRRLL